MRNESGREPDTRAARPRSAPQSWLPVLLVMVTLASLASVFMRLPASPERQADVSVAPATPWLGPPADRVLERIAFGSCLHQAKPQPIWQAVLASRPQLFLMLGDNVYGDVKDATLTELRAAYAAQARQSELAAMRATVPVLATWDDHDYGLNDGGGDFAWKTGSRSLFAEFWQLREGDLPASGVYRAHMYGPPGRRVQVILLDTRSFRSPLSRRPVAEIAANRSLGPYRPADDPQQSMLGDAQWAWLEAELRRPAEVRIVVSSIQFLADSHGWERWGNLPAERRRFLDLVERTAARGIVLLSGDRHRAAIYRSAEKRPYAIPEITSSSLNMAFNGADAPDPNRLGDMFTGENFGRLAIDWPARRLTATLNANDGREVARLAIGLDELAP